MNFIFFTRGGKNQIYRGERALIWYQVTLGRAIEPPPPQPVSSTHDLILDVPSFTHPSLSLTSGESFSWFVLASLRDSIIFETGTTPNMLEYVLI